MAVKTQSSRGTDSFLKYLDKYKDQVRKESSDGYYHVNVVAEAYSQGFSDGKKSGRKDFVQEILKQRIENFTQKANQVYILTTRFISFLNEKNYSAQSFYIDLNPKCSRILVVVNNELLNNDDFVTFAYGRIFELKKVFVNLFNDNLDMSLIGDEHLEINLLKQDGFGYSEDLSINNVKEEKPRRKK